MMFWYDHGMSGWGYAGMAIGMVRFSAGSSQPGPGPRYPVYPESPEQVLAARFARGEIDEADYQQRLAVLRAHAPR